MTPLAEPCSLAYAVILNLRNAQAEHKELCSSPECNTSLTMLLTAAEMISDKAWAAEADKIDAILAEMRRMDTKELRILAALGASERRKALTAELEILNREFPSDGEAPAATSKPAAKPYWTQTPEGKAKMARIQRKAWKTRRAAKAGAK